MTAKLETTYKKIDLRSDTVTVPTDEMRTAMANALVGDDVYGEDPTTNELELKCAKLFQKEDSLFIPSGTMGNLLAVMVHCSRRGVEVIAGDLSHMYLFEQGSAAHIAGVQLTQIENKPDGTFCLNEFKRKIRGSDFHEPITTLGVVENTHNMCGGKVIPLEFLDKFTKLCKENSMQTHMDGARIFNASEALNVPVARIARDFDSICFCLSKGLAAPVGSILVGTSDFIKQARRLRKGLGGAMRQTGILAAAGLISLKSIVPLLNDDHRRAKKIATAISNLNSPYISVDVDGVHTNIIALKMSDVNKLSASDFVKRLFEVKDSELDLIEYGIAIKAGTMSSDIARLVTHCQISDEDVGYVIKKLTFCIQEFEKMFRS